MAAGGDGYSSGFGVIATPYTTLDDLTSEGHVAAAGERERGEGRGAAAAIAAAAAASLVLFLFPGPGINTGRAATSTSVLPFIGVPGWKCVLCPSRLGNAPLLISHSCLAPSSPIQL